jgi:hypothetical protein
MNTQHTALITGASSGIGRELAIIMARQQFNLILSARRQDALNELKTELESQHGIQVTVYPKDLSKPGAADELVAQLQRDNHPVDVLVNNAGFGDLSRFDREDTQKIKDMIQVNIVALTVLSRQLLPAMIQDGNGRILNVASTAAFQPGPMMAVYYATKAYVLFLSEAISRELKGTGVTVTTLCPGPTASEFQKTASMEKSVLNQTAPKASSAQVAAYGYKAMIRGKRLAVQGVMNRVFATAVRIMPRSWALNVIYAAKQTK